MTMPSEIDVYGVYIPSFLVLMAGCYLVMQLLRRVLAWSGVYAFVWHRALFNLALYVILLGGAWSLARGIA
jgi:hypothetical protein